MNRVHRYISRIYLVAGFSLLLLAASFYFIGLVPLAERLRAEHVREIGYSIDSGTWLLQGVLDKHRDLAAQSASRTAIRKKQLAYLRGVISLDELVEFSEPKLRDALSASEDIEGISRFDPAGRLLFRVGLAVPAELAQACAPATLRSIRLLPPVPLEGVQRLVYCSPILDPDAGHVGMDILIMNEAEIWKIINAPESQLAIFGVTAGAGEIIYWPRELRDSPARKVLSDYLLSRPVPATHIIETRTLKPDDWHLHAVVDEQHFFAALNRQFRSLVIALLFVSILVFVLTVLVLRPALRAVLREEQLLEYTHRDGLTGLYNHVYMQELLDHELKRALRYRRKLAVMMLDVDHFKRVNDEHGHQAGDQVLRDISRVVSGRVRSTDLLARYGGEEFMLIMPETGLEAARDLAQRIRGDVADTVVNVPGNRLRITVSIGVACCDGAQGECSKHRLIEAADRALYRCKQSGRNCVAMGMPEGQVSDP